MANYWRILNSVIHESDIILEVLDARMPEKTRNPELEDKAEGKPIVYVLNKCDLISQAEGDRIKKDFSGRGIFVSTKKYYGIRILKARINQLAAGKKAVVGVVGYPNTGKSSLINALTSRSAAKASAHAGYTKGRQLIKLKAGLYLMDTPGVIPYGEDDEEKHGLIATINPSDVKEPDLIAMKIIRILLDKDQNALKDRYGVDIDSDDEYDILLLIGKKVNCLKKGGDVDERRAGIRVIQDWQRGKFSKFL